MTKTTTAVFFGTKTADALTSAANDTPFELDKKHLEFWNECIKKGSGKTFQTEFYLTPEFLDKAVKEHQKAEKE